MKKRILLGLMAFLISNMSALAEKSFYDLTAKNVDGETVSFSQFKGKTLLIVNTASKCGFTPQYKGLQALYDKYKERGFLILGFPSNDFGQQEPGSNQEVKKFCELNYKIKFPLFEKGPVTKYSSEGKKQPVYAFLTEESPKEFHGEISWNFEKFLIGKDGKIIERFKSRVAPDSPDLISKIEAALK